MRDRDRETQTDKEEQEEEDANSFTFFLLSNFCRFFIRNFMNNSGRSKPNSDARSQ